MLRRNILKSLSLFLIPSFGFAAENEIGLIVPFAPGGGGDVLARSGVDKFGEALGKGIVVLNKPGAGGNIGIRSLAKEKQQIPSIGYVTNGIFCVNPLLYKNMGFDPLADLKPIGKYSHLALVMVLNPNAIKGVTDLQSLIDYAKKHPKEVNFASSGVGTTSHVAGELFAKNAGVELTHIPHKGGAAAIVEVLAGRIPFMIDVIPNVINHVKSGKLKALAVTTPERHPMLPDTPTMKEEGMPEFVLFAWDGFVAPKDTSDEQVAEYIAALKKVQEDPAVKERLATMGATLSPLYGKDFEEFIKEEKPKWASVIEKNFI